MKKYLLFLIMIVLAFALGVFLNHTIRPRHRVQEETSFVLDMKRATVNRCSLLYPTDWVQEEDPPQDRFRPSQESPEISLALGSQESFFTIDMETIMEEETILKIYEKARKEHPENVMSFLALGGARALRYDYYSSGKAYPDKSRFYVFLSDRAIISILTDFPELPEVQAMLLSLRCA